MDDIQHATIEANGTVLRHARIGSPREVGRIYVGNMLRHWAASNGVASNGVGNRFYAGGG